MGLLSDNGCLTLPLGTLLNIPLVWVKTPIILLRALIYTFVLIRFVYGPTFHIKDMKFIPSSGRLAQLNPILSYHILCTFFSNTYN